MATAVHGAATMLTMLAEKIAPKALKPDQVAYCPTMDLVAVATIDEQVQVFRLNGQRVFGVANKKPSCKITQLRWKPNGQLLAVALSDSTISLINTQSGKAVHHISYSDASTAEISSVGWGINFIDVERAKNLRKRGGNVTFDKIIESSIETQSAATLLDLPTLLTFLDVESVLPKLSALPAGGNDDELFGTRASMDAVFHSKSEEFKESADVLIVGFADGTAHISVYDFFKIGVFQWKPASRHSQNDHVLLHSSHPYSSTHALLVSSTLRSGQEVYFLPLDLRLIPETGRYLSLLASKTTQLLNILRYIQEVQIHIYSEYKTSQELPGKFMRNVDEALQEKCHCSWVHAAYHLAVTGHCYPPVKEWLVEELGERGHKRWDKAVTTAHENIRRFAHEYLIPALDRFAVLVSRLRGLARFQESTVPLGLRTEELDDIFDTVNCLQLLAHNILISAVTELHQFAAFSAWMRQEIEIQGMDPTSQSAEETAEKDNMLDYASILEYIQGGMLRSRQVELLNLQPENDTRPQWDISKAGRSIYEAYKTDLKSLSTGALLERRLPGLAELVTRLESQCNLVFERIAETQKRKVRFGDLVRLEIDPPICYDMKMLMEEPLSGHEECIVYIATVMPDARNSVGFHRITLKLFNGLSSTTSHSYASIELPDQSSINDIKFINDESIMVALSSQTSGYLLAFTYIPSLSNHGLHYTKYAGKVSQRIASLNLTSFSDMEPHTLHSFPSTSPSQAIERIEVNGRKGRRVVCVVTQDRLRYRVFDLESVQAEGGAEAEGMDYDYDVAVGDGAQ